MDKLRDTILSNKTNEEPEEIELVILNCAKKHGCSEEDIRSAIVNACAARYRDFEIPAHVALAGPDLHGNLLEVLYAEQEDGSLVVFHAMKLSKKMARELEL